MNIDKKIMRLYAVTDRDCLNNNNLSQAVEKAIKGGETLIQLREKNLNENDFIEEAKIIKKITDKYNIPLIINDNVNVALAVNASGVHVGQGDMDIKELRKILGKNKIIGASARTVNQALKAFKDSADYLGVGAVFHTNTKLNTEPVSFETLKEIKNNVPIPIVAIGGINKNNITKLKGTGIDGIAIISAIFAQKDIEKSTKEIFEILDNIL